MVIFRRIKDIVTASINELLEKEGDPEATLDTMIREMERSIADLRKDAATAIAGEKMLGKRLQRAQQEDRKWEEHAEVAIRNNRDSLAREALLKKQGVKRQATGLAEQLGEQSKFVKELKENLRRVEEKVQEARIKRDTLLAKKRAAIASQKLMDRLQDTDRDAGDARALAQRLIGGYEAYAHIEEDVDEQTAAAEARQELNADSEADQEDRLRSARQDDAVEQEIIRLKRKLGK
jgi:phage shock protein A